MSREAMTLALEALKMIDRAMPFPVGRSAVLALRQALEQQPADEPVACGYDETTGNCTQVNCCYTRPQEFVCSTGLCRYRKPLRGEQFVDMARSIAPRTVAGLKETIPNWIIEYGRAIEVAHGITGEQE